jgi:hypothetical protein
MTFSGKYRVIQKQIWKNSVIGDDEKKSLTKKKFENFYIYKAMCLHLQLYCGGYVKMIANEINIQLISPPKVIYAELFCVKDTPLFSKLISESPVVH